MNIPICHGCENIFNLTTHIPMVLPKCGHTICSHCILTNLNKKQEDFVCKLDETVS